MWATFSNNKSLCFLYIDKFFDACWKDGLNLNDQIIIDKILTELKFDPNNFKFEISKQNIKDELKNKTEDAYSFNIIYKGSKFLIEEFPNSKDYYEDTEEKLEKI